MPGLSVVVVVFNIPREAPRTLYSLSAAYQRGLSADDYEVLVVDNGSDPPVSADLPASLGSNFRLLRIESAPASPAHAINRGIAASSGDVLGVMIDGARLVTPGLLHYASVGATISPRAVVASLGWYLGADSQGTAVHYGYDAGREDALLASIDWPRDGYRLFEIGTPDQSSYDGWLAPIAETNTLFMRRTLWDELGGADERFDLPGGGLLNLDMYKRALRLPGAEPVVLLGEGSFHQLHGGVATNARPEHHSENWIRWNAQYRHLRGEDWFWEPRPRPPVFVGSLPPAALGHFVTSATSPVRTGGRPAHTETPLDPWDTPSPANATTAELLGLVHAELRAGRPGIAGSLARFARRHDPDDPAIARILALTANHADWQADDAHRAVALARACRVIGDMAGAEAQYRKAVALAPDCVEAQLGLAELRMPVESYLVWLDWLYQRLSPGVALEIGVFQGHSLALHRPPTVAIGVDPQPLLSQPLRTETHVFPETSDTFFAKERLASLVGRRRIDVTFIDGLHRFEQSLRDVINAEAHADPGGAIVLHDTIPLDEVTQRRERCTQFYTGDVWRTVVCLKKYRPDLEVFTIATPPSGLTIVTGLDPRSRTLSRAYDGCVRECLAVPFAAIEANLEQALNIVPAERSVVEARLPRRRWFARS